MDSLLQQLKNRRLSLNLQQSAMHKRIGISRQQYQRLESKGNPRLATLELIATGLDSKLMLIPKEKLSTVLAVLDDDSEVTVVTKAEREMQSLIDDPWQGLLGDDDE